MTIMINYFKKLTGIFLLALSLLLVGCSGVNNNFFKTFFESLNIQTKISENLDLKEEYEYENKTISVVWTSSNENLLENDGTIHRSLEDEQVILIAEAKVNEETFKKSYILTIEGDTTSLSLEKVYNTLVISASINKSLSLPTAKTVDGKEITITWVSNNPEVLSNTGAVVLPIVDTEVLLKATISYGGHELVKEFNITVEHDPNYNPAQLYYRAPVYSGEIENEVSPDPVTAFPGAIYRKVQSSRDYWLGIETVVTLPEFIGDEGRTGQCPWSSIETDMRYLDNASVYMGGNCQKECDVGLSWSVGSANAECTNVDYSKSVAFRPFWRYITSTGVNTFKNANWADTEYYYYPGDTVRMSVFISSVGHLQLRIELLEETKIEKYASVRASYNLGADYEKVFVSPEFESLNAGTYRMLFKRVCALDQVNNEAKPTQPTNASSNNIIYKECYLYRDINGTVYKIPMTDDRCSKANVPDSTNSLGDFTNCIKVTYEGIDKTLGGEVVNITPNNRETN